MPYPTLTRVKPRQTGRPEIVMHAMELTPLRQEAAFLQSSTLRGISHPPLDRLTRHNADSAFQSTNLQEMAFALENCSPLLVSNKAQVTPYDRLTLVRSKAETQAKYRAADLVLWITIQGSTEAPLGGRGTSAAGEAILLRAGENVEWTLRAGGPAKPFLAMTFELDSLCIWEIAEKLGLTARRHDKRQLAREPVLRLPTPLLSCVYRTIQLLAYPESLDVLYGGIVREVCYWLLKDSSGLGRFSEMVSQGRKHRVDKAVHYLHQHFREPVFIERLAAMVGMSPATLHRHFREVMSVSPHQYLKRLRLLEARRLITSGDVPVKSAASEVGYESVSHFSKEFTRMFGLPPGREREQMN